MTPPRWTPPSRGGRPLGPSTMKPLRALVTLLLLSFTLPAHAVALGVSVEGVEGDLLKNVLALLDIEQSKAQPDLSPARIRRLHAEAPEQIRAALQPFGYYRVQVDPALSESGGSWEARYRVTLGPPVTIGELDLAIAGAAADDPEFQRLRRELPLALGAPLVHAQYEESKAALLRLAAERGYLDARFSRHEVRVDVARNSASVDLLFESGPRYRFGAVSFDQEDFDGDYLRRFVKFNPGDPYSTSALLALQRALSDTGNFQWVEVRPLREQAFDKTVPIEVALAPRLPRQWRFGLGYGTDTGPRLRANHTRRIGRAGHSIGADMLLSDKIQRAIATYSIPLQDPTTETLSFSARYSKEETESRVSRIEGLTASMTALQAAWQRVLSLNFERERYTLGGLDGSAQLLYPAVSWTRVRADDRIRPEKGNRLHLELRGAADAVASDTDFAQVRAGVKWVRRFWTDNRVLVRADLGATEATEFDRLPASQRFYAGGDNSVRGFGYEQLGPRDASGLVVGGRHLAVGSVELEREIAANWSVAMFYDAGNAFNSIDEPMARGAGVGLRWNSPVGPVRLDFAWAVSTPGNDFRLHLVVGPDL